ncbi:hypothetical protein V6N12_070588 [Hibiscus sabdariffa]|uniref:Mannan endo-1,4-beta-mannosidase n=1 Tax=Hibiscus sabdariffa TaxID=183260 RepID=A0ABR2FH91_9ROSI
MVDPSFRVRAVNLGGWLVAEGWIKPSLFDGIVNKDFLDGTQLQFKSVTTGKYLSAEQGGGSIIVANRTAASGWETFRLWRINETAFNFRVFDKQFIGLDTRGNGTDIVAISKAPGNSETFEILRYANDKNRVRIKAPNGYYLQAKTEDRVTADSRGSEGWGDDDPSVFVMTVAGRLEGEFQVTNGYGPEKAPLVMREHWDTFIVEKDFEFISQNGLNAVRIPVGWWIASDPTPPPPFVGGSLASLDNAFLWAEKYGLKVIIDLHAAPGSQNGFDHSSSRDGFTEWGQTDETINQTVTVIEFLTARYAKNPSLFAVQLINEPSIWGATLDNVIKYYKAGYAAVRRHTSTAFVVMANRLGSEDPRELFPMASGLQGSVIDVHYYNLYEDKFNNYTVQQNIDFVYNNRSSELNHVTTSNGPRTFIGEWVAEWQVKRAAKEDYQRFAKAELEDGTALQFKSVTTGKYLSAEQGGGSIIVANRTAASGWETFRLWRINETAFNFRVFDKQFIGLDTRGNGIDIVAISKAPGNSETFEILRDADDKNRVRIKAPNGYYLQAKTEEQVTADSRGSKGWGDDDPSVFVMTVAGRLEGEFQVTNGYGPEKAPQVMREHWNTFIVEKDFEFISQNGLNAVRIPVGWWIASDPTPPPPFVGGSLASLDNAFLWAEKYGLKVIIDLHAAPGSQNGWEHSGTRDASQEWGKTDETINQTIFVIEFLTVRYAKSPSLYAVELINEPLSPGATLSSVIKYYKAGYAAVRKHTSTAFVVMSNRLGPMDSRELFPMATCLRRSVIDVHYYNLFEDKFNNLTVQQNIDFVYNNRSSQLNYVTTSNGPLTFVGEWVAEWQVNGATKEDYQRFAKAELEVYGRASFGWAYWTLKNVNKHWSLEWTISNGYIKL